MASHTTAGVREKEAAEPVALLSPDPRSGAKPVPRLFSGLSSGEIGDIMEAGVVRRYPAGQTIIRADDPGTHLFLIKTGSVDYHRVAPEGQQVLIIRFFPGDTFGFVTLLAKPIGYIGTAEATRETELFVWERAWVRHFAGKHPILMENALRIGLEYIKLYSDRHLALVSDNAEDRLRHTLSLLEIRAGQRNARGLEVQITNENLASLADISFYTTSRLLNKWKRKGAVEKSRGKVVILCPERMLG